MMFSSYPFSAQPFSSSGRDRRYYVDMAFDVDASFEFKIFVASTAGFATRPTDHLPSQPFRGVLESYSFERDIINSEIGGFVRGQGALTFSNVDIFYDFLPRDYSIEAQPIVLRAALRNGSYDLAYPFGTLTATGWSINSDNIQVDLVDNSYKLEVQMQPNLYAGTGGAEGGTDLAGQRKPMVFGPAREIKPVMVDAALLVMQSNDGPLQGVVAMRVRGVALTAGTDYPTYAALAAATVAAGLYATCLAGGYQRLGFLSGDDFSYVTADVMGDNRDGYVTSHADIIRWALRNRTVLLDPDDLDIASFTATNAAQPATIDYWIGPDDSITVADFVANIISGAGGWAGLNREGRFEVRVFSAPSGEPAMRFSKKDMLDGDIKRAPLPDAYRPPPWRWRVPYARCWTVQTNLLAGGVSDEHRMFVAEQYRIAEFSNAAIKVDHQFGKDRDPVQAYFSEQAPAAAEAQRRSALFKTQRAIYSMTLPRRALKLNIGSVIEIQHPRFDLSEGRLMRVVSIGDAFTFGDKTVIWVRISAYG